MIGHIVYFPLFVTYGIDLVSILRYYILVLYQSQNYGIEPSLVHGLDSLGSTLFFFSATFTHHVFFHHVHTNNKTFGVWDFVHNYFQHWL